MESATGIDKIDPASIKEGQWKKTHNGVVYVYQRTYYYDHDTKNTKILTSKLLYKLDKDGNHVPTRPKKEKKEGSDRKKN